jgi:hypothetical protein
MHVVRYNVKRSVSPPAQKVLILLYYPPPPPPTHPHQGGGDTPWAATSCIYWPPTKEQVHPWALHIPPNTQSSFRPQTTFSRPSYFLIQFFFHISNILFVWSAFVLMIPRRQGNQTPESCWQCISRYYSVIYVSWIMNLELLSGYCGL